MRTIDIEIKVLTPMFSYGSDRYKSEFRVTELKALMRTTFREVYEVDEQDKKNKKVISQLMKDKEAELFGSLKNKSPITFFLCNKEEIQKDDKRLVAHHSRDRKHRCIAEEQFISIKMFIKNEENLYTYIYLLILSSMLGGLGERCRRGNGSFKILSIKEENHEKYTELLKLSADSLFEKIYSSIEICHGKIIKDNKPDKKNIVIEFDKEFYRDYPYIKKLNIMSLKGRLVDYNSILFEISRETHERLKEGYIKSNIYYDKEVLGGRRSRFASPVYVTFWENNNGDKYMIIKELNYRYMKFKNRKGNEIYVKKFVNQIVNKVGER